MARPDCSWEEQAAAADPAVRELEAAAHDFLCKLKELAPRLPRNVEECATGVSWAVRQTLGEVLEGAGLPLRHPPAIRIERRRLKP